MKIKQSVQLIKIIASVCKKEDTTFRCKQRHPQKEKDGLNALNAASLCCGAIHLLNKH